MTDATLKDTSVRRRMSLPAIPVSVAIAIGWIVAMLVIAAFAEKIAPYGYTQLDLRNRLAAPGNVAHWLGTDELGRDVLSRLLVSIRISLLIAFGATAISAIVGTTLGFLAAHFRGPVEQLVLMLSDFQASMPFLIMALAVLAFFGNSLPLLIGLMGFFGWERYARIARGLAISANAQGYAAAVRQLGATPARIYLRHILPNIASTLIVSTTLVFPEVILMESGLSFLGLGVQPPMTSLGNMVGYGREYLTRAPWIMLAPATTIVVTTLAVSVIGDWLRDRLDPTLHRARSRGGLRKADRTPSDPSSHCAGPARALSGRKGLRRLPNFAGRPVTPEDGNRHASLSLPYHHPRPQHGGRPRPLARDGHEGWRFRQADHRGRQLLHPVRARPRPSQGPRPARRPRDRAGRRRGERVQHHRGRRRHRHGP
jgi:peptide/nickel transport system permease protein